MNIEHGMKVGVQIVWNGVSAFVASASGYEVPDLDVRIGASRLNGLGTYKFADVRPRIDVKLSAPKR